MEYFKSLPVGVLLGISITVTVIGDFFAKYWSKHPSKMSLYFLTMSLWMVANVFFIPSLLKKSLIVAGLTFTFGNIIGFTLVGLIFFKESLNATQITGIILGCIAVILLNLE